MLGPLIGDLDNSVRRMVSMKVSSNSSKSQKSYLRSETNLLSNEGKNIIDPAKRDNQVYSYVITEDIK
jgi:hypothetical protein